MDLIEIAELKKKIESGKEKLNRLKGEKEAHLKTLKEDFGCENISEAKNKIEDLDKKIKKYDKQIESKSEDFKKEFPQLFDDENDEK